MQIDLGHDTKSARHAINNAELIATNVRFIISNQILRCKNEWVGPILVIYLLYRLIQETSLQVQANKFKWLLRNSNYIGAVDEPH